MHHFSEDRPRALSAHEGGSRTIRRISDATVNIWVFLVTWARNVLEEIEVSYFMYDLRLPTSPGVRRDRDRAAQYRPNPYLRVGGLRVFRVQVLEPKRLWALWLEDRSKFILDLDTVAKAPKREDFKDEQSWKYALDTREQMIDLFLALGMTRGMKDGQPVVYFGPILLQGWDTGFTKKVMSVDSKRGPQKMRVWRVYKLASRIIRLARERGDKATPPPVDAAYDAQMGRMARLEQKRTNRSSNSGEDLSPDVVDNQVASRWEFYPDEACVGEVPVWFTGAAYGQGRVPPAYSVRLGLFQKEAILDSEGKPVLDPEGVPYRPGRLARIHTPKLIDGQWEMWEMRKVQKTVSNGEWKTDYLIKEGAVKALVWAIRRELDGGQSPFVVQPYRGFCEYTYSRGRVAGIRWQRHEETLVLACKAGDKVELPMACARSKVPVDYRKVRALPKDSELQPPKCGGRVWEVHEHGLRCAACGSERWRVRIMAYVRVVQPGVRSWDEVGRHLIYDREVAKHLFLSVPLYGPEVTGVLMNLRRAGRRWPTKIVVEPRITGEGTTVQQGQAFLALQRFWLDYTGKTPEPTKNKKAAKVWSPNLPGEPVVQEERKQSGSSDPGWCSDALPRGVPADSLEGIRVRTPDEVLRDLKFRAKKDKEAASSAVERAIRDQSRAARRDEVREGLEALGLIRVSRKDDGTIDLD